MTNRIDGAIDEPRERLTDGLRRRFFLGQVLAAGIAFQLATSASADGEKPGADERPQEGDTFVFAEGDNAGRSVNLADVVLDAGPVQAWPMDPKTKVVRDGSRLNQVLLLRLNPGTLDDDTRANAAEGIVAYSAICAHAGCVVTEWVGDPGKKILKCPCHDSQFDPRARAEVVGGPAPRNLAMLPVKLVAGVPTVRAKFTGRVGGAASG